MFYFALAVFLFVLVASTTVILKGASVRRLDQVECDPARTRWPLVSIIAPARNEERHIEAAIRSLVKIDYEPLQITIINDRSTDSTGDILNRLAAEFPQLNVIHLESLPSGWLGKNHALQLGADRSRGQWLLFTDADIVFEPSALRRAITLVEAEQLDMLCGFPETRMPSWLLRSFVATFSVLFMIFTRPWSVKNPRSSAHCGVGAFNLLRSSTYQKFDGHRPLAMRPDDDLKLGKNLKLNGAKCDVIDGSGMFHVHWYSSVRELIVGLEKNSFAAVEYSVVAVVTSSLALLVFNFLPFVGPCFTTGAARWLFVAAAGIQLFMIWGAARHLGYSHSTPLGYPVTILLFVYIQWRSMLLTLRQGGIRWRDTFYSLKELRANRL